MPGLRVGELRAVVRREEESRIVRVGDTRDEERGEESENGEAGRVAQVLVDVLRGFRRLGLVRQLEAVLDGHIAFVDSHVSQASRMSVPVFPSWSVFTTDFHTDFDAKFQYATDSDVSLRTYLKAHLDNSMAYVHVFLWAKTSISYYCLWLASEFDPNVVAPYTSAAWARLGLTFLISLMLYAIHVVFLLGFGTFAKREAARAAWYAHIVTTAANKLNNDPNYRAFAKYAKDELDYEGFAFEYNPAWGSKAERLLSEFKKAEDKFQTHLMETYEGRGMSRDDPMYKIMEGYSAWKRWYEKRIDPERGFTAEVRDDFSLFGWRFAKAAYHARELARMVHRHIYSFIVADFVARECGDFLTYKINGGDPAIFDVAARGLGSQFLARAVIAMPLIAIYLVLIEAKIYSAGKRRVLRVVSRTTSKLRTKWRGPSLRIANDEDVPLTSKEATPAVVTLSRTEDDFSARDAFVETIRESFSLTGGYVIAYWWAFSFIPITTHYTFLGERLLATLILLVVILFWNVTFLVAIGDVPDVASALVICLIHIFRNAFVYTWVLWWAFGVGYPIASGFAGHPIALPSDVDYPAWKTSLNAGMMTLTAFAAVAITFVTYKLYTVWTTKWNEEHLNDRKFYLAVTKEWAIVVQEAVYISSGFIMGFWFFSEFETYAMHGWKIEDSRVEHVWTTLGANIFTCFLNVLIVTTIYVWTIT